MIPCPYCEREFEKRAGVMRHVTVAHPAEGAVPTNVGGAIEPVVPVEVGETFDAEAGRRYAITGPDPETYAEGLTAEQLEPGQEPYIDPPVSSDVSWEQTPYDQMTHTGVTLPPGAVIHLTPEGGEVLAPDPTVEQYKRIRQLRREGLQEREAWMTVVGYEPPVSEPAEPDGRPVRLQQVAFRVRNGWADQMDARWLLRLADLGAEAVAQIEYHQIDGTQDIAFRWQEALR